MSDIAQTQSNGKPAAKLPPVRRVVTGHNAAGRSIVVSDELAPCVSAPPSMPELVATVLWTTAENPPSNAGNEESAPAGHIPPMAPGGGGTIFRIADFPPDSHYEGVDIPQMFREIGGADAHDDGKRGTDPRHFWFHKTPTLDYAVVIDGEVWALLDEDECLLSAGDVLVQRGTNHAWSNRSDSICRVAFVLIDAAD